jgi:membrane-associated PAP2 superfamily phosphatase
MMNSYFDKFGTIWRCRANYDLEVAIHQCLKHFLVAVDWQWVRGHAIKRKQWEKFTRGEALNDAADHLATEARDYSTAKNDHWPEQDVSVIGLRG